MGDRKELDAVQQMDPGTDQLFALLYDELKRLARRYLRRERSSHTLQPTALVNEAYIQLSSLKSPQWQNRSHFLGTAALAMRRVLTDYARDRHTAKRGGGHLTVSLDASPLQADPVMWDYDDLDVALSKLEGAIMMSRLQRNAEALRTVQAHLYAYLDQEVAAQP